MQKYFPTIDTSIHAQNVSFGNTTGAILTKPIKITETTINKGVNTLLGGFETERKKKSYKKAVYVASGVLVATTLIALLNPRTSAKTLEKLKNKREAIRIAVENSKEGTFAHSWYKFKLKMIKCTTKLTEIGNDFNNGKDILWKRLCCNEKASLQKIKFKPVQKILQGIDKAFVFVMKKPHKWITKEFDKITQHTIKNSYKKASKKMTALDTLIATYKSKLSGEELRKLEEKLAELQSKKQYFDTATVQQRLTIQEKIMEHLEQDVADRFAEYGRKITKKNMKFKDRIRTTFSDLHFFAEEILQPEKTKLETAGSDAVTHIIGQNKTGKGLYDEIIDILSPHLNENETNLLAKKYKALKKQLQKANRQECSEYFDKKRDLVLGSAPTDIVTAVVSLGLASIAIGKADSKEQKINRAVALGFPAIMGVGTSLYLTSILFSGAKNILASAGISAIVSKTGSFVANKITGQQDEVIEDNNPATNTDINKNINYGTGS